MNAHTNVYIDILKLLHIVKLFSICIDYTSSYESTYLLSLSKALKIEIFFPYLC